MNRHIYTKEEKKQIKETLDYIIADIEKLYLESGLYKIELNLPLKKYFAVGPKKIVFVDNYYGYSDPPTSYTIARVFGVGQHQHFKRTPILDYDFYYKFTNLYGDGRESIREMIKSQIKAIKAQDTDIADNIKENREKYEKQASIIIDMPETIDQKEITITTSGDKKIGTIDFGDRIIQIITTSDIVLKSHDEETDKVKKIGTIESRK